MKLSNFCSKRLIFLRPSYNKPSSSLMLPDNIDRENDFCFVCCVKVVIRIVDIDCHEGAVSPYFDGKEMDSTVILPIWKYFVDEFSCRDTVVLGIQLVCMHFDHKSLCFGLSEYLLANLSSITHGG